MIQDTILAKRPLRPSDDIVQSLIALRDEYWEITKGRRVSDPETKLLLKINSCLYKG